MKCSRCRNEVEVGKLFCPHCQNSLINKDSLDRNEAPFELDSSPQDRESTSTFLNSPSLGIPPQNKKKIKTLHLSLISLAVLFTLSIFGGFAYRNLDFILSAKNYYLFLEVKNYDLSPKSLGQAYEDFVLDFKKYFKNYHPSKNFNYTMKLDTKDTFLEQFYPESRKLVDIINGLDIQLKADHNMGQKKLMANGVVAFKGTKILNADFYVMDTLWALNMPLLNKKFMILDTKQQENIMKLFKSKEAIFPKKWLDPNAFINAVELDKNKIATIAQNLENIYKQSLPPDAIRIERNVNFDVGDDSILAAKKISLLLSNEQTRVLYKDIFTQLSTDETFLSSIENTLGNWKVLLKDSVYKINEPINPKEVKEKFKKSISDLLLSLDNSKDKNSLSMILFVDEWGRILKRNIEFSSNDTKVRLEFGNYTSKNGQKNKTFSLCLPSQMDNLYHSFESSDIYQYSKSDKRNQGILQLTYKSGKIDQLIPSLVFSVDYTRSVDILSDSRLPIGSYNWNISIYKDGNIDMKNNIKGLLEIQAKENKKNGFNYDFNLKLQSVLSQKPILLSSHLDSEDLQQSEVQYPDFSTVENINLSTMKEKDFDIFSREIIQSFQVFKKTLKSSSRGIFGENLGF